MRARLRWFALVGLVLPLILAALLLPGVLHAAPVTRHVTSCADSGAGSLRAAVAAAQSGDTIAFDQDCTIALASSLTIPSTLDLTIDALAPSAHTVVLDGGNAVQILALQAVNNHGPAVTLNGLTLRNGKSPVSGGAIFNDQGALTVTDASFLDNSAATSGGAIENAGGTLRVTNSTFAGNRVAGAGVATGGAIDNNAFGRTTVTASTLVGNSVSSTVASSSAGGGIFDYSTAAGSLTLVGSIVAGNTGGNCGGADIGSLNPTVASGGRNLIGANATGACGPDFALSGGSGDKVGTASAAIDAKLGTPGNYGGHTQTIPLLPGSPAIDAGACPAGVATDQRGIARPQGASCDSGAFESRGVQSLAVAVAAGGPTSLKVGQTAQYVATGTFDGGGTADISAQVAWSSDAPAIVAVDATGKATGIASGTANIVATSGTAQGSAAVTVAAAIFTGVQPAPAPASRPGGAAAPSATPAAAPSPRSGGPASATGGATVTPAVPPQPAPPSR